MFIRIEHRKEARLISSNFVIFQTSKFLHCYDDWFCRNAIPVKTRLSPDISGVENFGSSISGSKLDCLLEFRNLEVSFTDLVVADVSAATGIVGGGKFNNSSIKTLLLAFIQFSLSFDGMLLIMVFNFILINRKILWLTLLF